MESMSEVALSAPPDEYGSPSPEAFNLVSYADILVGGIMAFLECGRILQLAAESGGNGLRLETNPETLLLIGLAHTLMTLKFASLGAFDYLKK